MSETLLEQLRGLGDLDASWRVFGAATHRYFLCPPLGEAELAPLEAAIRAPLPQAYREFVTQIASGGVGPGYGLYWLGAYARPAGLDDAAALAWAVERLFASEATRAWRDENIPSTPAKAKLELPAGVPPALRELLAGAALAPAEPINELETFVSQLCDAMAGRVLEELGRPFPFTEAVHAGDELHAAKLSTRTPAEAQRAWDRVWRAHGLDRLDEGALPLCDYGHSLYAYLVVCGPEAGHVWLVNEDELMVEPFGSPHATLHGRGVALPAGPTSFDTWYEHWLACTRLKLGHGV